LEMLLKTPADNSALREGSRGGRAELRLRKRGRARGRMEG